MNERRVKYVNKALELITESKKGTLSEAQKKGYVESAEILLSMGFGHYEVEDFAKKLEVYHEGRTGQQYNMKWEISTGLGSKEMSVMVPSLDYKTISKIYEPIKLMSDPMKSMRKISEEMRSSIGKIRIFTSEGEEVPVQVNVDEGSSSSARKGVTARLSRGGPKT